MVSAVIFFEFSGDGREAKIVREIPKDQREDGCAFIEARGRNCFVARLV